METVKDGEADRARTALDERRGPRPVALLLPGQGAQHARMGTGLYDHDQVFTATMDTIFSELGREGARIRADWLSAEPAVPVDDVLRAQPLLFAVDYALGRTVMSWGVLPAALLGHSVGEMAAATLAGVFTLRDAVQLTWDRLLRLSRTPPGGMLAVAAGPGELEPYLNDDVVIGAVNGPRQVMLAGTATPLAKAAADLRERGFTCRPVRATIAFHSPAVACTAPQDEAAFAGVRLRAPVIPLYSGYTGRILTAREARDPAFWARQPSARVVFGAALDALLAAGDFLLLEAGPSQSLTTLARRHRAVGRNGAAIPLLPPRPGEPAADRETLLRAVARLRDEGYELTSSPS
ncbi:acyltransferase domain-containing protein [Sphaerisporangium perillae]|uniref:acyltransferase domain-containing protein n=1 Tax=Sphaerisporangium perillae TaxID=2935860 RepID=UPI00200D55A1|nr:acyltransferase domain-containing protein [Sphaerisporangium perillae]